jgi:capsular polysaccharide biosynthesis protein
MEDRALSYLRFMVKKFYIALIITFLFGLLGFYYGHKSPPSYETRAYVAVTQLSYTLLPSQSGSLQNLNVAQVNAPALAMLVKNPVIAQKVIERLKNQLDEEQKNPDKLLTQVEGDIPRGTSGLIEIGVSDRLPERAKALANLWAKVYVDFLNNLYRKGEDQLVELKVASFAPLPLKPASPSTSFLAALGLMAGFFLSLFILLVWAAACDLWAIIAGSSKVSGKRGKAGKK